MKRLAAPLLAVVALAGFAGSALGDSLCERVSNRFRTIVEKSAAHDRESLSGLLARVKASGFVKSAPLFQVAPYTRAAFAVEAAHQSPSFVVAKDLDDALEDMFAERLEVHRLPRSDLYAGNQVAGTAHCNASIYFRVSGGAGHAVEGPKDGSDDSCGMTRVFGSLDGQPVVIDDDSSETPVLVTSLSITQRLPTGWAPTCRLDFSFEPSLDPAKTLNDWNEGRPDCTGPLCGDLRKAALALLTSVQAKGLAVRKDLVEALTPEQRASFEALRGLVKQPEADAEGGDAPGLDDVTEQKPFAMPLVVRGKVYLARIGHFTIGWRTFGDWAVAVDEAAADDLSPVAHFAIGMTKGRLRAVTAH